MMLVQAIVWFLQQLKQFDEALHEHIHLENNIIFPKALELEQKNMK